MTPDVYNLIRQSVTFFKWKINIKREIETSYKKQLKILKNKRIGHKRLAILMKMKNRKRTIRKIENDIIDLQQTYIKNIKNYKTIVKLFCMYINEHFNIELKKCYSIMRYIKTSLDVSDDED